MFDVYNGITLYKLKTRAYYQYIETVKGNKYISKFLAKRKLTRNIMLSKHIYTEYDYYSGDVFFELFLYGSLLIRVENDVIVQVKNHRRRDDNWELDKEYYNYLSKILDL